MTSERRKKLFGTNLRLTIPLNASVEFNIHRRGSTGTNDAYILRHKIVGQPGPYHKFRFDFHPKLDDATYQFSRGALEALLFMHLGKLGKFLGHAAEKGLVHPWFDRGRVKQADETARIALYDRDIPPHAYTQEPRLQALVENLGGLLALREVGLTFGAEHTQLRRAFESTDYFVRVQGMLDGTFAFGLAKLPPVNNPRYEHPRPLVLNLEARAESDTVFIAPRQPSDYKRLDQPL